ncbi:MAG: hypothetical protein MUP27_07875 [Desulfobacterales bacterium]|nr:hypothetical protein [Desulfobacterales bacterium]
MGITSIRVRGIASWQRKQSALRYPSFFVALLLIILLSGCPVKLIAPYDETTEKEASLLQKQVDQFITELILDGETAADQSTRRAALKYDNYRKEYVRIAVDFRALKIRTEAVSMNELSAKQVQYLIENFEKLEARHKMYSGGKDGDAQKTSMSNRYLEIARDILNEQFKSLLALELAKKKSSKVDSKKIED